MAADFNGDGRFDGYDMQYLEDGSYGSGNGGCDDVIKYGCCLPLIFLFVAAIAFTIFFCIIEAIYGN